MRKYRDKDKSLNPVDWYVEVKTRGRGYLVVSAASPEEAEEAAWEAYHAGEEVLGQEWDAEEMVADKPVE